MQPTASAVPMAKFFCSGWCLTTTTLVNLHESNFLRRCKQIGHDIEQAAKMKKKTATSPVYLHPLQTISKFLWTMSQSSAASTGAMKTPADAGDSPNTASPVVRQYIEALEILEVDIHASGGNREPFLSGTGPTRSIALPDDSTADFPVIFKGVVSAQHSVEFQSQGLNLVFELEGHTLGGSRLKDGDVSMTALCRIRSCLASSLGKMARANVDKLLNGKLILERPGCSEGLHFILEVGAEEYIIELYWLGTDQDISTVDLVRMSI